MTSPITQAFVETFNSEVKQQYQGYGKLRMTVRMATGVVGSSHAFPIMDAGTANLRGAASSDLVALDGETSLRVANMEDWDATQFVDDFEQFRVNWSIRDQYVMKISKAIGRREDQIILNGLQASTTTKTVANNVSGSVANLTVDAIRAAGQLMDDDEVDEMMRHFAFGSSQKQNLLGITEATSADFVNVKALTMGDIDTFYGFKFHMIGSARTNREGGLVIDGNQDRTCLAYHYDALGYAMADDIRTRIGYSESKGSYVVRSYFSAGSIAIDDLGIVKVTCRES